MSQSIDSLELEALFESVSSAKNASTAAPAAQPATPGNAYVYDQVSQMVRQLHDSLAALGYDQLLAGTLASIPDARDRLSYVAQLTGQAANRVLNATDVASPLQNDLSSDVKNLGADWQRLMNGQMDVRQFKRLAQLTHGFFNHKAPESLATTQAQLLEIMMAQDFQDLTGQVLSKVAMMALELERGLQKLLLDVMPESVNETTKNELINGPVVSKEERAEGLADQQQVDNLLDSLGF